MKIHSPIKSLIIMGLMYLIGPQSFAADCGGDRYGYWVQRQDALDKQVLSAGKLQEYKLIYQHEKIIADDLKHLVKIASQKQISEALAKADIAAMRYEQQSFLVNEQKVDIDILDVRLDCIANGELNEKKLKELLITQAHAHYEVAIREEMICQRQLEFDASVEYKLQGLAEQGTVRVRHYHEALLNKLQAKERLEQARQRAKIARARIESAKNL